MQDTCISLRIIIKAEKKKKEWTWRKYAQVILKTFSLISHWPKGGSTATVLQTLACTTISFSISSLAILHLRHGECTFTFRLRLHQVIRFNSIHGESFDSINFESAPFTPAEPNCHNHQGVM